MSPSRAAAPEGPDNAPRVWRSISMMCSFSLSRRVPSDSDGRRESSSRNSPSGGFSRLPSERITERSTMLWSDPHRHAATPQAAPRLAAHRLTRSAPPSPQRPPRHAPAPPPTRSTPPIAPAPASPRHVALVPSSPPLSPHLSRPPTPTSSSSPPSRRWPRGTPLRSLPLLDLPVTFLSLVMLLGEWPGALQPQALAEPYVTVSRHTAPTIRSLARTTRQ